MKCILGEKVTMTQFFDGKGRASGATIIKAGPAVITQVKTVEKDGYSAIQIGAHKKKS